MKGPRPDRDPGMLGSAPCGCVVHRGMGLGNLWIEFCRLHGSAAQLFEALCAARRTFANAPALAIIDQAINAANTNETHRRIR